ncbi:MAG: uracil phosphoribosyltransferase [Actinomycetota bacterium]|nr:uracil phosphoribosyltransferase [Acidimicrobiia bacterium]MDQ3292930.1 uracil phosphoribosyltransferase [Actinomycetota bacterium]
MALHLTDHPLVTHRVAELRQPTTDPHRFRVLTGELAAMLAYEAARGLATDAVKVPTPLGTAEAKVLSRPRPLIVPILRAGLGMLDATLETIPTAGVALLGLRRNEETLEPAIYADTVQAELNGCDVFLVDPMLATGGSLAFAAAHVRARGAGRLHALSIVAAPEGIERVQAACPDIELWPAVVDPGLNDVGYIVPGLGDAGDRLFGPLD